MTNPFIATHEITFTPANGAARTFAVALVDGAAYTREEWENETSADWECTDDGEWLCQGQVTPGGAVGEVSVRSAKPAPEYHLHHAGKPLFGDGNAYHMGDRDPVSFDDLDDAIRAAQSLDETCGWDIDVVEARGLSDRTIAWGH